MATNMDRALYAAPQGLDQLGEMDDQEPLQITVVDPEAVDIEGQMRQMGVMFLEQGPIQAKHPAVEDLQPVLLQAMQYFPCQTLLDSIWFH